MRKPLFVLFAAFLSFASFGQRYKSTDSYVRFFSSTPLEDIEAVTEEAISIVDLDSKNLVIAIPIKSFDFEKELMEEHFNENYLESDKYPRAVFKGSIVEWSGEEGESPATAKGTLEIHGVTRDVEIEGKIIRDADQIQIETIFMVKLEDYKVKIPKAVFYKIAEEVEVTANITYASYETN